MSRQPRSARLNKTLIESLTPGQEVSDSDMTGLSCRRGVKRSTFFLRYTTTLGVNRRYRIGVYPIITPNQARRFAIEVALAVSEGRDPAVEREKEQQQVADDKRMTCRYYLDNDYAAYLATRKSGAQTRWWISHYFADWLDHPIVSLTPVMARRWQAQWTGKIRFVTIARAWSALHAMIRQATRDGLISHNPFDGFALLKSAKTESELASTGAERRFLTADEVNRLFEGLSAYQDKKRAERRSSRLHGKPNLPDLDNAPYVDHVMPWVLTMYYTGFRNGDINGLRWEHILWPQQCIRKVIEKTAHKNPAPRQFPLSDKLLTVLTAWHRQQGKPTRGYVFPSPASDTPMRLGRQAMRRPWIHIKRLGGLPAALDLYSLRHNYASQLVMGGVDLLTVSKLMAHQKIETTLQFYGHLQPNKQASVANAFANRDLPHQITDESELAPKRPQE